MRGKQVAAKTGAGETPDILIILWWWALKDVVRRWRKYDRGWKLECWDEIRTPAMTHMIWFGNVFPIAGSYQTSQAMLDDVTKALWETSVMSWTPK